MFAPISPRRRFFFRGSLPVFCSAIERGFNKFHQVVLAFSSILKLVVGVDENIEIYVE